MTVAPEAGGDVSLGSGNETVKTNIPKHNIRCTKLRSYILLRFLQLKIVQINENLKFKDCKERKL